MPDKKFVDIHNARPGTKYESVIRQISQDGVCPFCPEQLHAYHKNPIFKETEHWKVTDNMYPYKSIKHQILFIHKEHIQHMNEMSKDAWMELQSLIQECCKDRGISGGALVCRFGDTKYTGASVNHLHAQLVQSNPDAADYNDKKEMSGVIAKIG